MSSGHNKKAKRGRQFYEKGLAHNEAGNWGLADEEFYKALVVFQGLEQWTDVVNCHCSVGNVSHNKGNLRETVKHWTSAAEICIQNLHDKGRAAELYMDIGDLQYEGKEIYAAGDSYEKALHLFEEEPVGQTYNTARVHQRLGNVCFSQDRADAAEKHFIRALTDYDSLGREDEVAVVTKAIGHIYLLRGDTMTAKENFVACYAVFAKMGREDVKREVAGLLVEIDNREKSIELTHRLKAIEAGGAAAAATAAAGGVALDGAAVAALEGAGMAAALTYGAGAGADDDDLTAGAAFAYNPASAAAADAAFTASGSPASASASAHHTPLRDINPAIATGNNSPSASPVDSKTKGKVSRAHHRLTQRQELRSRTAVSRSPHVPLHTAPRDSRVPTRKI